MGYELAIGDRSYSSWSLRGWLLFDAFGIPVETRSARLYTEELPALLRGFHPARTAPALRLPDGTVVMESLAIAEELASRHPEAGLWPADPSARAAARSLAAEMHAGFGALRSQCPMNLRVAYAATPVDPALRADLDRLEAIWDWAREVAARPGPSGAGDSRGVWLFGAYSAADAFFAPVATRVATYGLPMSPGAVAYVEAHLAHPSLLRWRELGLAEGADQEFYRRPYPTRPWPGPSDAPEAG